MWRRYTAPSWGRRGERRWDSGPAGDRDTPGVRPERAAEVAWGGLSIRSACAAAFAMAVEGA